MDTDNIQTIIEMMKAMVDPWYQSLANPANAQEIVLKRLLNTYSQTEYGRNHRSENVGSYNDYKKAFPVQTFDEYKPLIDKVFAGNTYALLNEEIIGVGCTRGTSKGLSKLIPITTTELETRILGNRVPINYALTKQQLSALTGYYLNTNNRSNLGIMKVGNKDVEYGYSGGVYLDMTVKTSPYPVHVTPTQDEINDLGGGSTRKDWEARHELIYEKAREKNVTFISGVASSVLYFGRYLHRKYKIYPKDIWQFKVMIISSLPGINTRLAAPLHTLYGKSADIREVYAATEGLFGGQLDDKKAWAPFYDIMFFEIQTINGIKQLHEMTPGEIGSLIVSTPVLPRYRIGDLILAFEPPYFRCIGRENSKIPPFKFGKL
jgi:hypothetical protein